MPAAAPTKRAQLEQSIEADAENLQAYQVYGDFLQEQGDPRGELIALRYAAIGKSEAATAAARKARALEKKHRDAFVGDLASIPERALRLEWRMGFIHHAYIDQPTALGLTTEEVLRRLLAHPSARFLRELMIGRVDRNGNDYRPIVERLSKAALPSLRTLWVGVGDGEGPHQTMLGNLEPLTRAFPRLTGLLLTGNGIELGDFALPSLTSLSITTWALSEAAMVSLTRARISLGHLSIDFGANVEAYDERTVEALLVAPALAALVNLQLTRLKNIDRFAARLAKSPIAKKLERLKLTLASMSDVGALALSQEGTFPSLIEMNAQYNRLSRVGREAIKHRWPTSNVLPQYG